LAHSRSLGVARIVQVSACAQHAICIDRILVNEKHAHARDSRARFAIARDDDAAMHHNDDADDARDVRAHRAVSARSARGQRAVSAR
jgi:hypothetical protein